MKKMRLLTFMQLAETNPEMSFETIQSELQIEENDVESFIIDGKLINFPKKVLKKYPKQMLNYFYDRNNLFAMGRAKEFILA